MLPPTTTSPRLAQAVHYGSLHDDDCRRQRGVFLWRQQHDRHLPDQYLSAPPTTWVDVVFTPSGASNIAPTAIADTGDATENGGTNNGTGGLAATGNVLTNDTDPNAGDTKTVTAVSFGATKGTLGAALTGAHGSLVLNASGHLHLYGQ